LERQTQLNGFATEGVGELSNNNTEEERGLSVFQSFSGVANWSLGNWGNLEDEALAEFDGVFNLLSRVTVNINETHSQILVHMDGEQPIENLSITFFSKIDTFGAGIVEGQVWFWNITDSSEVSTSVVRSILVIDIKFVVREVWFEYQSWKRSPWETEIIQKHEVANITTASLDDTHLDVSEGQESSGDKMLVPWSWKSSHNIQFWLFVSEGNSWENISTKIDAKNQYSGQWKWNLEDNESEERNNLWNVGSQSVGNGFLQVIENLSTFFNTQNNS